MPEDPVKLPPDAIAALMRGNMIEAIKCVRNATGLGLKEAKDAVDFHIKHHLLKPQQTEPEQSTVAFYEEIKPGRSSKWIWIVLLLGIGAYLLFSGKI